MGSLSSTIFLFRSGKIDLKSIAKLFPFVFIASMIGAYTVHFNGPECFKTINVNHACSGCGIYNIKKDWGSISTYSKLTTRQVHWIFHFSFCNSIYDGFFRTWLTGSFLIFAFLMIGFDFLKAAGNAKFLNFASNIGALLMFVALGQVNYSYGIIMGIGQIIGAICGTRFAIKKGSGYVRVLFIVVTVLLLTKEYI